MGSFFTSYMDKLQEFHDEIRKLIKGLPQNALDWTASPDINSINVLVVHLIGAERYWIGDVVAGDPSGRVREAEFKVHGLSEIDLIQKLTEIEIYLRKTFETCALQELEEVRISPRNGLEVTVGWAMCHAATHTALHVGHIEITRQLWEQQQSS